MGLGNLGSAVMILFIFMILHLFLAFSMQINNVRQNWDEYKCNPLVMPFTSIIGHDPVNNLNECIRSTQADYMKTFLDPIYDSLGYFAQTGAVYTQIFEDLKIFGNDQQDSTFDLASTITNRIQAIITEMSAVFITVQHTVGQAGSLVTILYNIVQLSLQSAFDINEELLGTFISFARDTGSI